MAAVAVRPRADPGGIGRARRRRASATRRPTRSAARRPDPHDGAVDLTDSRHSGAPAVARRAKIRMRLLAHALPERFAVGHQRAAADLLRRRLDRGRRAGEPHARAGPRDGRWPKPAAACRPIRWSCGSHRRPCIRARASPRPWAAARTCSEISVSTPSVPSAPVISRAHVEAGDVLHHAAAEREVLALAVEHAHAEHDVAHRAARRGGAARTIPRRPCRRASRRAPKCGGSQASICPAARSVALDVGERACRRAP